MIGEPASDVGPERRRLRVHLRTADWSVRSDLSLPTEPTTIAALLPFLWGLAGFSTGAAEDAARNEGRTVSCRAGCGACCRQLVATTLPEALALARLVEAMPEPRRTQVRTRFEDAVRTVTESGVLRRDHDDPASRERFPLAETADQRLAAAWFSLGVACPFLEAESCSIHPSRPLVCREYLVTSPSDRCARLYREPVARLEMRALIGQALARATARFAGVAVATVPLIMSLQIPPAVEAALGQVHDPLAMLEALLAEIGDWRVEPAPLEST